MKKRRNKYKNIVLSHEEYEVLKRMSAKLDLLIEKLNKMSVKGSEKLHDKNNQ
jgi:uncharacterized coiled-coil protein SlyX